MLDGARAAADATKAATTVSRMTVLTTGLERVQGVIRSLRDLARVKVPPNVIAKVDKITTWLKSKRGVKPQEVVTPKKFVPIDVPLKEFETDALVQKTVYDKASDLRARQETFGKSILEQLGIKGDVSAILKREDIAEFVEKILEKTNRPEKAGKYHNINQLDDIVRGRFDLSTEEEVESVNAALRRQTQYPVKQFLEPKATTYGGETILYYPRYHVIINDIVTGLSHEWQIGTSIVSKVFDKRTILLPKELGFVEEYANIHDVEYAVFGKMEKSEGITIAELAKDVGIPKFREDVARLADDAAKYGVELVNWEERLKNINNEAGLILQRIVDDRRGGVELIRRLMH